MKHIKLVGHGAFLPDWEHLEPAKALSLLNYRDEIVPFLRREGVFDIDLQALQAWFVLSLGFILLLLLLYGRSLRFVLLNKVGLLSGFEPFAQGEVSIHDHVTFTLLVLLSGPEDDHLAWNLGVGMRSQEVLGW